MNELILKKLHEIEEKEGVTVLHAVESGSRAWGFASPDSDYDVRFIYLRSPEYYLKLEPTRDVIEWQLDETLDVNGWDLQKMLRLLYKSNPTIFEWMNSPIVYKTTPAWEEITATVRAYFQPKAALYHYLSTAKRTYLTQLKGEAVKYKKYFYILRPLLAARWVQEKKESAPMLFADLLTQSLPQEVRAVVEELLAIKRQSGEAMIGPHIEVLDRYAEEQMALLEAQLKALPEEKPKSWEPLDHCFIKTING
ncbi:MAG: nucleotidyltransferase domain-containing protein [Clostridia bacterium]|nr:nucleotidyltransferase domain-containing protein [Clostridia bacterium]